MKQLRIVVDHVLLNPTMDPRRTIEDTDAHAPCQPELRTTKRSRQVLAYTNLNNYVEGAQDAIQYMSELASDMSDPNSSS